MRCVPQIPIRSYRLLSGCRPSASWAESTHRESRRLLDFGEQWCGTGERRNLSAEIPGEAELRDHLLPEARLGIRLARRHRTRAGIGEEHGPAEALSPKSAALLLADPPSLVEVLAGLRRFDRRVGGEGGKGGGQNQD